MSTTFSQAVHDASCRPEIHAAVQDLYRCVQSQIDLRRPICQTSGRCCRFDEFGHRLYVTTAEMGTFLHELNSREVPLAESRKDYLAAIKSLHVLTSCPYQIDGLCSVHSIRPFGCRIFFCDATATDWQREQYEIFHAQIKQIHERFEIPYFYMEWRAALREIQT